MEAIDIQSARTAIGGVAKWAKLTGEGVSIASFAGFNADGQFLVALSDELEPVTALSTIGFAENEVGAKVVVAFEKSHGHGPIIIGRLQERTASAASPTFKLDGERLVLRAEREIELRCGEASIVLTQAGKVLIRGNYVLTRSRGANKIKGAYVDIN